MAHQTHNKSDNQGVRSPLRVSGITNQCVNCGSTFADRSTAQNHVVNSWTRGTCKTDRSHMTWAVEEITHPMSCNLCAQEFGDFANVLYTGPPESSALPITDDSRESVCRVCSTTQTPQATLKTSKEPARGKAVEAWRGPRQLRRTVSRTKQREGGASGSASVLSKPKGDGKVEQKSLNKIMLKAILKTHQTMRDLYSTVWDTLLIKAESSEADNMQKQTKNYAEKVRQEERGHTRGPPFVWAYQGLVKSLQQRGNAVGARNGTAHGDFSARLEPPSPMQICDEVRFCRLDKTYKADIKRVTLNIPSAPR